MMFNGTLTDYSTYTALSQCLQAQLDTGKWAKTVYKICKGQTPEDKKHSHSAIPKMEVGVAAYNGVIRGSDMGERSPGKGLHVNFTEKGEVKERREKFLTAKYGSHQMSLIRKRLAVEMWLYDELQKLYESTDSSNLEVEVDIDELLDMDDDNQRRRHLHELLVDAKKSPPDVKKFVNDLLERTKTL